MATVDIGGTDSTDARSVSAASIQGASDSAAETIGAEEPDPHRASSPKMWRSRIEKCRVNRREYIKAWSENVDYRRGKPFHQETDVDRVNVNLDWSLTKGKHAQLYSQTPQVYLTARHKQFAVAVPVFAKRLNEKLTEARVGAAVDESVLDAINASGVGVVMVGYEAKTVNVQIPDRDVSGMVPEVVKGLVSAGLITMTDTPQTVDTRYYTTRLSPSDFLWPTEFTGSDFDNAPWVGRSGSMLWAEAKIEFNLDDKDRDAVCGAGDVLENLRQDTNTDLSEERVVEFDEVFYWAYRYDPDEKYFKKIRRIVFVRGLSDPVVDEEWAGQKFDDASKTYVGSCKFPIRVLTLTYLSDDAIPPSDSAIGRPQVLEMIRSRSQIVLQRDRSLPMRWFNTDRIGTEFTDSMMKGTWNGMLPVQGDGSRAIGEVARANYPTDDMAFDRVIKQDLQEQWQVGSNQIGSFSPGDRSASEAKIVQQNFQSRIGYERARVSAFFTGIAEVMAGLLALYDDFPVYGQDEIQRIEANWDRKRIAGEFVYYIRPDSTILLDANQRIDQLMKLLNLVGKSGFVNPEPIITEIVELHGLDPADVMTTPKPPEPKLPAIGYTFKGEDMMNPVCVAIMLHSGQGPSPEEMQAAKHLIASITDTVPLTENVGPADPTQPAPPAAPLPIPSNAGPMERITKRPDELGG